MKCREKRGREREERTGKREGDDELDRKTDSDSPPPTLVVFPFSHSPANRSSTRPSAALEASAPPEASLLGRLSRSSLPSLSRACKKEEERRDASRLGGWAAAGWT